MSATMGLESWLHPVLRKALHAQRAQREARAPTGLRFVIADSIHLMPTAWDLLAQRLWMRRSYLAQIESASLPNITHRYAMACDDGGRPVVAVSMQEAVVSADRLHSATQPGLLAPELEEQVRQRVLVCGNLFSGGLDGVAFAPDAEPELAWRAVAEALYRVRRSDKLTGSPALVAVKDLSGPDLARSQVLSQLGYRRASGGPTMVLTLDPAWRAHSDYLAAMTSKFRSAVKRKVLAGVDEAGLRVSILSAGEVSKQAAVLQRLYLQVQSRAALRPATLNLEYWPAMVQLEATVVAAVWQGADVVGFLLMQHDGDALHAAQIGFDRAVPAPLYLRLLHTAVEVAIERRCQRVYFGRTALEPKARMGALAEPTFIWARHGVPVVNAITRGALAWVQAEQAPDIDPFKA